MNYLILGGGATHLVELDKACTSTDNTAISVKRIEYTHILSYLVEIKETVHDRQDLYLFI